MWQAVRYLSRRQPLVLGAFVLSTLFTGYYAVKVWDHAVYFSDPSHRSPTVSGWMTPGYVALAHGVAPQDLRDALGLPPPGGRVRTLAEIARARGVPLPEMLDEVRAVLAAEADR